MNKTHHILLFGIIAIFTLLFSAQHTEAQQLNDKLLNRPYADNRKWHLGFSIGLHTQDLTFTHNGLVTPNGESWYMEQPAFSPGFCVNGLFSWRLNDYFSLRFTPGLYFGNREIKMHDVVTGADEKQNLKSTFVVTPIDVKFASMRFRNSRPYVVAGVMPAFDINKKRSDFLQLKSTDVYLTVGFGCDFYLPYFKFNPEIKFCFGLADVLQHKRPDLIEEPDKLKFTESISKAKSRLVVLTFYFE
jgi:hypothetical protein